VSGKFGDTTCTWQRDDIKYMICTRYRASIEKKFAAAMVWITVRRFWRDCALFTAQKSDNII